MDRNQNVPDKETAEALLNEALLRNPGPWGNHSRVAAFCAERIAKACDGLDADTAYICGLLHDIGRRDGVYDMKHLIVGYRYMKGLGYDTAARISLTHSFPSGLSAEYSGKADITEDEKDFIRLYIEQSEYDDYDRLIQLCDALSFAEGPVCIEKRLVNVAMRYGFNEYTLTKWKSVFSLKEHFDGLAGQNIYGLIGVQE